MDKCQRKVSVCARQKSLQGVLKDTVSGEVDWDKKEDKPGITCGAARLGWRGDFLVWREDCERVAFGSSLLFYSLPGRDFKMLKSPELLV